jgi:hypothetical protein
MYTNGIDWSFFWILLKNGRLAKYYFISAMSCFDKGTKQEFSNNFGKNEGDTGSVEYRLPC